jgi:hypothetical protein
VENIKAELDTLHEWYYDSDAGILYYIPPKGLNLRHSKIEASVLRELIVLKGDTSHPVSNIHFEGITFMHTKRTFMLTREPLLRGDWKIYRGSAVLLSGTKYCTFSNCNFKSLGGNALFFSNYNRYDAVKHSLIEDIGANGISFVGSPSAVRSPSFTYSHTIPYDRLDKKPGPKNDDFPKDCFVYDNLIHNTGQIEKQTAGVEISMSMNISVIHNTIYHVPRAGININDGDWGGDVIKDNEVFKTVLETSDNGAFNSWGRDRYWSSNRGYMDSLVAVHPELVKLDVIEPIIIRHNLFECHHGWDIDLDDGSSNYVIEDNLCLYGGIKNREGFYRTVENNIMINNTFYPQLWFKNNHDIFIHNIVMRSYKPFGMHYWGDSIDYNVFPDSASLRRAQSNGTDAHSAVATPEFYNPLHGDYRVKMNKTIRSSGFHNFSINDFGVVSPRLQAITKKPEFPIPVNQNMRNDKAQLFQWKGAVLKKVKGLGEKSAFGLPEEEGIYILKLSKNSIAYKKGLRKNDVILKIGNSKINTISDFEQAWKNYKNTLNIEIYRFQKKEWVLFTTK